ncbi:hypothetical protein L9W92_12305 [Pelotomaculum terephthalicicum JT]|uniref:hypothetical protein n=1 Tax=Pelotomaculum TaxID=191373 RepID=UPI0009C5941F|nr:MULTISPECIES: hypothetical protein [Pelotomaculum]MCG9968820.1 hypothetical protein [Pelotomaculum terephthalicicum JT]OPX89769.1 MAG: hypothetical protein A4E54_00848 [Pelotomaculum sp. PtaB.Bin117]OPY63473.1 MAG: hypothetical protein A4E56_00584 [Pelotomaculum sp. PtaU1.Bin065]
MTVNKRIIAGILLLILIVGGSYFFEQITKAQGSRNGRLVPVIQHDETTAYLDAGVIRQLGRQEQEMNKDAGETGDNGDNEVSLGFVLGSAGVAGYQYIEVSGAGDSEDIKLGPRDIGGIVLSSNSNSTFAMADKAGGNRVIIKEVAKIYVAD